MGGLFGLLATLLVFLLQMWWDNSKLERERFEKDEATYSALKGSSCPQVGDFHLISDRIEHTREDLEAQVLLVA